MNFYGKVDYGSRDRIDLDRELDYRRLYRRELQKVTERRDELTACCPFHNDRSPSLSVNLRTGQYHCHACGAEGNYVNFIAELRGISTTDAFKAICEEHSLGGGSASGSARVRNAGNVGKSARNAGYARSAGSAESAKRSERRATPQTQPAPVKPEKPWNGERAEKAESAERTEKAEKTEKAENTPLPSANAPAPEKAGKSEKPEKPETPEIPEAALKYTLADYAAEKYLPEEFLREIFRMEQGRGGRNGSWLKLPYCNEQGEETIWRGRSAPGVEPRFRWEPNKSGCIVPYGLWLKHDEKEENAENDEETPALLKKPNSAKKIVLVEGESDTQTLTYLGIPALGIPGASSFKAEWGKYLEAYDEVYIHVEPDQGGQTFLKTTLDRLGRYFYDDDWDAGENPESPESPEIPFAVYQFTLADLGAKDPSAFWVEFHQVIHGNGDEDLIPLAREIILEQMENAEPLTIQEPGLTEIPGADFPFRMPEGWHMDETGVYQLETKDDKARKICEPILVTGFYADADGSNPEEWEIRFSRRGEWKNIRVSSTEAFGPLGAFGLLKYDVPVHQGTSKALNDFLWAMQDANLRRIPVYTTVNRGGWRNDGSFMPYGFPDEKRRLKWSDSCHDGLKAMEAKGTLEGWRKLVEPYRKNPTLRLLMAAALTAPTLLHSGMRNLWVHLSGPSGSGKTAAMRIAASIWGDPERLPITFDATENAFLELCRSYNDLPMFINEKQVCGNNFRFDQLVYKAVEGKNRSRLKRDCTLQDSFSWRCVFISNGEERLNSQVSHEGVRGRVLELTGAPFSSLREARGVYDLQWDHYGVAGETLIRALQDGESKNIRDLTRKGAQRVLDVEFPDMTRFTGAAAELAASDYLGTLLLFPPKEGLTP